MLTAYTLESVASATLSVAIPEGSKFVGYTTNNTPTRVYITLADGQTVRLPNAAPAYMLPAPWDMPAGAVFNVLTSGGSSSITVLYDA